MKLVAIAAFLATVAVRAGALAPHAKTSNIAITIFACAQDSGVPPTVQVASEGGWISGSWADAVGARIVPIAYGVYRATFRVLPGYYLLSARSAHCHATSDQGLYAVLGHSRSLSIALGKFVTIDAHPTDNAIAVLLPAPGLASDIRSIRDCALVQRAKIDDGVAYYDALPPGKFLLRLYSGSFVAVERMVVPQTATYHALKSFSLRDVASQFRATASGDPKACSLPIKKQNTRRIRGDRSKRCCARVRAAQ
jgi:hypothetical protein